MKRVLAAIPLLSLGLFFAPTLVAQTTIVNHLTMNQWVRSTDDGALKGRIVLPEVNGQVVSVKDVNVAILGADGEIRRATSDASGEFSVSGVAAGVYALTARGDELFACCAMHVIDPNDAEGTKFPEIAEVAVANIDYTVVKSSVIRYMPPSANSGAVSIVDADLGLLAERVCGNDLFRVAQSKGGMTGQIHLAGAAGSNLRGAEMTNVFVYKSGRQIARTLTDESGHFAVDDLPFGHYSLLAIGAQGIGLIGFELVDEAEWTKTTQNLAADSERLVGLRGHGCCCQEFAMQIAPMPEIVSCVEEVVIAETIVEGCVCEPDCPGCECCQPIIEEEIVLDDCFDCFAPVAGCGVCGGSGGYGGGYGGGGGGGGGGGLGGGLGLLGLIGLAGLGGDGGPGLPVIASPLNPAN